MTRQTCNRAWEAEARIDGRLGPKDEASFVRHLADCPDCTRATERLERLAATLSAIPHSPATELERRRARADLLRKANQGLVEGPRQKRAVWIVIPAIAIAAALVFLVRSRTAGEAPSASIVPRFEVTDVHDANVREELSGTTSKVHLSSGTASFHVEHLHSDARFLVALPDGEVEVRGTRFVIDVEGGKTRSVVVTEGFVEVRLEGFRGLLHAGERWPSASAALEPAASATAALEPAAPSSSSAVAQAPIAAPVGTNKVEVAPGARPAPSANASGAGPSGGAGPRFVSAMKTYEAGDYGRADVLFESFAREFPNDSRAEDALFLRADARARRGDREGASRAAADYLKRYPNGFRRAEAQRLVIP
jgi:ferric-dicitrate binding protein FerR (iron transport regulator)